jgi:hypothetical protein
MLPVNGSSIAICTIYRDSGGLRSGPGRWGRTCSLRGYSHTQRFACMCPSPSSIPNSMWSFVRSEQRQGVDKVNAGARLVMERASFSLGRQTPARRSTLIPSTPLRGTPRAAALRLFYISLVNTVCVVACLRTTYLAPISQPSTVTLVRALAMKCSLG